VSPVSVTITRHDTTVQASVRRVTPSVTVIPARSAYPGHGSYPADSLQNTITRLIDRKVETADLAEELESLDSLAWAASQW
jgi:hypothetical protein